MVAEKSPNPPDSIHEGCGSRHSFPQLRIRSMR
jgi:hypothetical protein